MTLTASQETWARGWRDTMLTFQDDIDTTNPRTFTGGTIIISDKGQRVLAESVGRTSYKRVKPYTFDTIMGVRSASKNFTGSVIAKLVEEGRVSYNTVMDDIPIIRDYVTGVVGDSDMGPGGGAQHTHLTLRHFLTHCNKGNAGFGTQMDSMYGLPAPNNGTANSAEAATWMAKFTGSYGTVNDAFDWPDGYNDKAAGFAALAAESIAQESGRTIWRYEDMLEEMFEAYGMTRSYAGIRWDTRANIDYFQRIDVAATIDDVDVDVAEASNQVAGDPPYTIEKEHLYMDNVYDSSYGLDASRMLGYAGAYSTPNDMLRYASLCWKSGKYLTNQTIIDDMFDYNQGAGYFGKSRMNDGTTDRHSDADIGDPNYLSYNNTSMPFRGWTLGHYIYKDLEDKNGVMRTCIAGEGAGGGGYGCLWIACPDLDIVGVANHAGPSNVFCWLRGETGESPTYSTGAFMDYMLNFGE